MFRFKEMVLLFHSLKGGNEDEPRPVLRRDLRRITRGMLQNRATESDCSEARSCRGRGRFRSIGELDSTVASATPEFGAADEEGLRSDSQIWQYPGSLGGWNRRAGLHRSGKHFLLSPIQG